LSKVVSAQADDKVPASRIGHKISLENRGFKEKRMRQPVLMSAANITKAQPAREARISRLLMRKMTQEPTPMQYAPRFSSFSRFGSALLLLAALHSAHAGPLRDWLAERRQAHSTPALPDDAQPDARPEAQPDKPDTRSGPRSTGSPTLHDLPYGNSPAQTMDVYLPPKAQGAPLILMVHGGAWAIGDKAHGKVVRNKIAHWLPQGVALVSINYRMLPGAMPLEQAHDVARALAKVQAMALQWGVDPLRIVLMGHSAGAHLVALLSASPELAAADGAKTWLGTVMLDSAALDVVKIMQTPRHPRLYDRAFGDDAHAWRQASPWHVLQRNAPPMLAVCASQRASSCEQAQAFADKARALGANAVVLPQDLSHGDINGELGLPGPYTEAVDRFLAGLPGFRPAASP
jgi:arylformamidase